jgi:hypothetical protein
MSPRKSTLKDRPEIFRRTSNAEPEVEELGFDEGSSKQTPNANIPKSRKADLPKDQNTDIPLNRAAKKKKTSFGLPLEADIALTMLQIEELKRSGKKPSKDELVSRAILDMAKQRNINLDQQ